MALHRLRKKHRTRQELLKALTPRTRSIHLSPNEHSNGSTSSNAEVLSHIKQILSLAANSLEQHQQPISIIFHNKTKGNSSGNSITTKLDFPLNGPHLFTHQFKLKRCSILLNLLKIVMEKLPLGQNTTIRDIFYSNVELFQRQANVVQWLDVIRFNFKLAFPTKVAEYHTRSEGSNLFAVPHICLWQYHKIWGWLPSRKADRFSRQALLDSFFSRWCSH